MFGGAVHLGVPRTTKAVGCLARLALSCTVLAACLLGSATAWAGDDFRVSGFGTLGYVMDNRPDIAPARDISQKPQNNFRTGSTARMDSNIGLQLEYRLAANVDLVSQLEWRDHFQADFDSATELAYAAWQPSANIDMRVGRLNYDAFLMSDHRNVGYAYAWVRPPSEFYSWIPIFSIDGIDAAYNFHDEAGHWRLKLQAGDSRFVIPIGLGYDFHANNLWGVSLARQTGDWRFKATYSRFTVASEVAAFAELHAGLDAVAASGLPGVSAEAADLRRNLSFSGARVTYTTLGAAYDDGRWFGQGELGHTTSSAAVVPHGRMGYLSVGRRFGDWAPYLTISTSHPGNPLRTPANNWGAFNAPLRDPALFVVNTTRIEQSTAALGIRWDFNRQAALKLQWDRTRIKPSGYGSWWRDLAINHQTTQVDLLTATLDFVF